MNDSLHDFVVSQLAGTKGRWPSVAKASGVSLRSLEKIARREVKNPRVANLEKLARHFRAEASSNGNTINRN